MKNIFIVFPDAILVILMVIYAIYSGYYADIEYNYPIYFFYFSDQYSMVVELFKKKFNEGDPTYENATIPGGYLYNVK